MCSRSTMKIKSKICMILYTFIRTIPVTRPVHELNDEKKSQCYHKSIKLARE